MQEVDETGQKEGIVEQASGIAQDAASVAQEKVSELREEGSARLVTRFDRRSAEVGSQARSLADTLRRSVSELSSQGNAGAAKLTAEAAQGIERFGRYLEQTRGDEVMRDIETFARRQPWLLAGVGVLAGATAARFVKASSVQPAPRALVAGRQQSRPAVTVGGELQDPVRHQPRVSQVG